MGESIWIAIAGAIGVASGGFFGWLATRSKVKQKVEQNTKDIELLKIRVNSCPCDTVAGVIEQQKTFQQYFSNDNRDINEMGKQLSAIEERTKNMLTGMERMEKSLADISTTLIREHH